MILKFSENGLDVPQSFVSDIMNIASDINFDSIYVYGMDPDKKFEEVEIKNVFNDLPIPNFQVCVHTSNLSPESLAFVESL